MRFKLKFRNDGVDKSAKDLEAHFKPFRMNTIGIDHQFVTPYGKQKILYADWTASGRLYGPIEHKIANEFGPFVANTHTESNVTGNAMTQAYKDAKQIIKQHVHADDHDVILLDGSGMTSVINKFQRILGLRLPEGFKDKIRIPEKERPVFFVTHMEHHSNQLSWAETIGDVVSLEPSANGQVNVNHLAEMLHLYRHRKLKIGSFTACSNVTGIRTPYYQMAKIMHEHGGLCFVDFSASAPYLEMNMHPDSPLEKLDAIFFSPHKFLGGPGTSGVLVFDAKLYGNRIPDRPGGGTVSWVDRWGGRVYIKDIEAREDGGTPGFLQAIRTALSIQLKEDMGIENMVKRESELVTLLMTGLAETRKVHIFEEHVRDRLGIVSFTVENIHYNLIVKLLNDRFGIQVRGGCSCAGPYGHYLLNLDPKTSKQIASQVDKGNSSNKPGWVRISVHPIMTNQEILQIIVAVQAIIKNIDRWRKDYIYDRENNDFIHVKRAAKLYPADIFKLKH